MKGYFSILMAAVVLFSVSSCKKAVVSCISTSSNVVNVGEAVDFTSCSVNGESYVWSFGDGATSTESNPSHTYDRVGVYEVTLTALAKKDKKADEQTLTITVLPNTNNTSFAEDGKYKMTFITVETEQRYNNILGEALTDTVYRDTVIADLDIRFIENGSMVYFEIETITGTCNDFAVSLSGNDLSVAAADAFVCSVTPANNIEFNGLTGSFTENGAGLSFSYSMVRDLPATNSGIIELEVSASGYRYY